MFVVLGSPALAFVSCAAGTAAAASCSDGIKNQDETGVDTGGVCGAANTGTCTDGIRNGDESGVDAGGRCGNIDNNCYSRWDCYDTEINEGPNAGTKYGLCVPEGEAPPTQYPVCFNSTYTAEDRNKVTTDTIPPGYTACAAVCPATPPPSCNDGIQNQNETGVDTGGVCAAANQPPARPTLTGSDTTVNTPANLTVIADDPDGTTIKYGLTDASCGAAYQWIPGDGSLTADNVAQPFTKTYITAGQYTVYAFAVDAGGVRSTECGSYVINVNPAPAPTADLKINNSDGPLNVPKNTAVTLSWSSQNAASCTMYGEGMGTGTSVPITGSMPATITTSGNFVISCSGAPDQVAVNVVNQPPTMISIDYVSGARETNQPVTFRVKGTDADNDSIFYEIDWDNNGSTDATTQTVASGVTQDATRAFTQNGTVTFQVRTVDTTGAQSAWLSHQETITAIPPTATLALAINGGSFSQNDQTINPGDTISLQWNSQNADSCAGTGPGFDTGAATQGTDAATTPAANTTTTFTASCSGPGGNVSEDLVVTVRQLPNFSQPSITHQLSGTFDPLTGAYSYIDVTFNTTNNGGSDTAQSANYQFQFDRGRDGYELTTTGSLGLLTVNQTVTKTERVNGPIMFGNARIRVAADNTNAVIETDETDNERVYDLALPPPDPGLNLTADRVQLREGETTTLRWSTAATYPSLSCKLYGPNLSIPSAGFSGNRTTAPITAQSLFTYECTESITGTIFKDTVTIDTTGRIEEI